MKALVRKLLTQLRQPVTPRDDMPPGTPDVWLAGLRLGG
jgi:hypothetical protein